MTMTPYGDQWMTETPDLDYYGSFGKGSNFKLLIVIICYQSVIKESGCDHKLKKTLESHHWMIKTQDLHL